jgi:hypothetical protein
MKNTYRILVVLIGFMTYQSSNAQTWGETSLEHTSPGTAYTKFQFAEHTWSGSHAILLNAYKSVSVSGSLGAVGNTRYFNNAGPYGGGAAAIMYYGNGGGMGFYISPASTGKDQNISWGKPKLWLNRSGQVGVNTSTIPAGYAFAVDGRAIMEEVRVATSGDWPDYVFAPNFELRSLDELERFIGENGHLPNIPDQGTVDKEGVELGDMSAKLLEKIEELTLYIIEQNKRIDAQQSRIEALELTKK